MLRINREQKTKYYTFSAPNRWNIGDWIWNDVARGGGHIACIHSVQLHDVYISYCAYWGHTHGLEGVAESVEPYQRAATAEEIAVFQAEEKRAWEAGGGNFASRIASLSRKERKDG